MNSDQQNGNRPAVATAMAWRVVALLWPVVLLNYFDRQLLSTMKKSIMVSLPDIGTEENFGGLMAIFMWIYAVLSPVGGFIADRFNRRWTIIGSLGIWSLVTWFTGHVHNYHQLWLARAAMGVSEAFYIPAALAFIADFHPGTTQSRAVGAHQTGIYAGITLGGLGGMIADSAYGWRAGFTWFGLAGVLYAVLLIFVLPAKPAPIDAAPRPASSLSPLMALVSLLGTFSFLLLVLYFTLPAMPGWIVKNWMPSVLADKFALGQGRAGISATLWVTFASFFGALLGGALADRWMRATARGRIFTSAIGMALLVPALFFFDTAPTLSVAVCLLILFGLGWGVFDTNNMPILCQIARPELRATGYGIMNMISISAGAWATTKMGALRDHGGAPASTVFRWCALAALLSVVLVLLIRPRPVDTR